MDYGVEIIFCASSIMWNELGGYTSLNSKKFYILTVTIVTRGFDGEMNLRYVDLVCLFAAQLYYYYRGGKCYVLGF